MDTSLQSALGDLLAGYFGDQSVEEGVEEMVFVTRQNEEDHRNYLSTLQSSLLAAKQGDTDVLAVIRQRFTPFIRELEEVRELLSKIVAEYEKQYSVGR